MPNEGQLSWDLSFLKVAKVFAEERSKDPSTKCGAALVSPDKTQVILGYNGFPRDMNDDPELYENREVKYSRVIHCEHNAILNARRDLRGWTLYTWPFQPCDKCSLIVIQVGIGRVVAPVATEDQMSRWGKAFRISRDNFEEGGVYLDLLEEGRWV